MVDKRSLVAKLNLSDTTASEEKKKEYRIEAGKAGEDLTQSYLDKWGTIYFRIEQETKKLPVWVESIGSKRPDFIAFTSTPSEIIVIDSKLHNTNKESFLLESDEIIKYEKLIIKLNEIGFIPYHMFIFPIGGMAPNKFFCLTLDDFSNGEEILIDEKKFRQVKKGCVFHV